LVVGHPPPKVNIKKRAQSRERNPTSTAKTDTNRGGDYKATRQREPSRVFATLRGTTHQGRGVITAHRRHESAATRRHKSCAVGGMSRRARAVAISQPPPSPALPSPLAAWRGNLPAHSTRLQAARLATKAAAAAAVASTTAPSRPTLPRRAVAGAAAAARGMRCSGSGVCGLGFRGGGGISSSPTAAAPCAQCIPRLAASGAPLVGGGRSPGTPPRPQPPPPARPPRAPDGAAVRHVGAPCSGRRKRP